MRISTLFCTKTCANRSRSVPPKIREQLITRYSKFSVVTENRPAPIIQDDFRVNIAAAKEELRKRGRSVPTELENITLNDVLKDNIKYINKEDPANGGSDGFGISDISEDTNIPAASTSSETSNNNSESGKTEHSNGLLPRRGLRRIGGFKNDSNI